jgi:hypothetical protein
MVKKVSNSTTPPVLPSIVSFSYEVSLGTLITQVVIVPPSSDLCFSLKSLLVCPLVLKIEGLVEKSHSARYTFVSYSDTSTLSNRLVQTIFTYRER